MSNKGMDFPQYRKLSNEKVFYKISDDRSFEEIQLMGKGANRYCFVAEKYPEVLRIMDMLSCTEGYLMSDVDEFNQLTKKYSL